ncbi:hypothetical protein BD309DRAFT_853559 [Dichomitus squalens]|nr:hypothetical protein BD309DRAFT_853559 [Dichomitus squalens]
MEPIVFYDIPADAFQDRMWSPNTWKTRYVLNIKGLPYTTVWVEFPDIAAVSKKIGALPTQEGPDGSPIYTLPAIYDPNTKSAISESAAIARYLEKTYPNFKPTLIPPETDALHAAFEAVFWKTLWPDLRQIMLPPTNALLNPRSAEYFRRTREAMDGEKLEDWTPAGSEKRERHWRGVERALDTFAEWLGTYGNREKLFFTGVDISYADITVASFLIWIERVLGKDSKEWQDVLRWNNGRWARFMDAFRKYEAVDVGVDAEV